MYEKTQHASILMQPYCSSFSPHSLIRFADFVHCPFRMTKVTRPTTQNKAFHKWRIWRCTKSQMQPKDTITQSVKKINKKQTTAWSEQLIDNITPYGCRTMENCEKICFSVAEHIGTSPWIFPRTGPRLIPDCHLCFYDSYSNTTCKKVLSFLTWWLLQLTGILLIDFFSLVF